MEENYKHIYSNRIHVIGHITVMSQTCIKEFLGTKSTTPHHVTRTLVIRRSEQCTCVILHFKASASIRTVDQRV